jgi:type I restriction enzyme R subunit
MTGRTPASSTTRRSRVLTAVLKDDTELFEQFMDKESFKRWLTDTVFGLIGEASA